MLHINENADQVRLIFYKLGIRIQQAQLIYYADFNTAQWREDLPALGSALDRVKITVDEFSQCVTLNNRGERCDQLLQTAFEEWAMISHPGHEIRPMPSMILPNIESLKGIFRDFAEIVKGRVPRVDRWFELGLCVSESYYKPPMRRPLRDDDVRTEQHHSDQELDEWWVPNDVKRLCEELDLEENHIFPMVEDDSPSVPPLTNLPECCYAPAWERIEVGLQNVKRSISIEPKLNRRKYARDHLFLKWYEDETSNTKHNPTEIKKKWNREQPIDQVSVEVVKKAISKARKERAAEQSGSG